MWEVALTANFIVAAGVLTCFIVTVFLSFDILDDV